MNRNNKDNNTEAVKIANALKPFAKNWFDEWGQSCVRSKKMTVTTAPNGSVIGVKDAFSDTEIFIKYMSSCANAVVGDTVWVKWMYDNMQTLFADRIGNFDRDNYVPVSGGTFTGNVTFDGVVDVTNRRCYANLSSQGWYRVLTNRITPMAGTAFEIDLNINRTFYNDNNETHKITLQAVYNKFVFTNESSFSNTIGVDKIRYTTDSNYGYVDIHYALNRANVVSVDFDVHVREDYSASFNAESLQFVSDSPSGETIQSTYIFENQTIVTNHTAVASLSTTGWYRVLEFTPTSSYSSYDLTGAIGALVKFRITRRYYWQGAENHEITLSFINGDVHFKDESSNSSVLGIDKIRYTTNSTTGFVDIHYICTQENQVGVDFDVYSPLEPNAARYNFISKNLISVSDAPSGETVRTTYTFNANAYPSFFCAKSVSLNVTDYGTQKFTVSASYYDMGNWGIVQVNPADSVLLNQTFSTLLQIENLPFQALTANGYVRGLGGTGIGGMDCWQVSGTKIYLRQKGGGNLLGTFGANPLLQVTIIGIK